MPKMLSGLHSLCYKNLQKSQCQLMREDNPANALRPKQSGVIGIL